jgi:2,4-dienoyl-CoA reductase-like NADH-dependent reductase (Old Yellow Enzyme family)
MNSEQITVTQREFVAAAKAAIAAGCDGIEVHAGNGYLFDQFHHTNINQRHDEYGGDLYARCRFTLETIDELASAVGAGRVAVRLSPFGLFNQTFGVQRVEQWTYLCEELSGKGLAYVHIIEPRFDEYKGHADKQIILEEMGVGGMTLAPFREALRSTPMLVAGGFGPDNYQRGLRDGSYDFVAFGRFFIANPDLVDRLKRSDKLYKWDRKRFYGPFEDNEMGYTVHPSREYAANSDVLKAQLAD